MAAQKKQDTKRTGISNRESATEEAREREEHPPLVEMNSPRPEDTAGAAPDEPLGDTANEQTSGKAGSRSMAQKETEARYDSDSMPPTRKVQGAFGAEPKKPEGEPN